MRFNHFNISATYSDLEKLRDFYCYLFDMEVGFRPTLSFRGFWLYSEGLAVLHLAESERYQPMDKKACLDHIAFRCEDVEKTVSKLEQRGIPYKKNVVAELKLTQLFLNDPMGIGIEINFSEEG